MAGSFNNILAIDTSVNVCSAAVLAGAGGCVARIRPMERGHAEYLVPMIEDVMRESGLGYSDLEAIAVTSGPGAFTGIRIGLSAAQAFGLSLSIPVFGISTMQALALGYAREKESGCVVAIDTRRGDFYAGLFDARGQPVKAPRVASADDVAALAETDAALIGDGVALLEERGLPVVCGFEKPDVCLMASLLKAENVRNAYFTLNPAPVYLRDAETSMPENKQRRLSRE